MMNYRNHIGKEILLVSHVYYQNVVYFDKKHLNTSRKRIPKNRCTVVLKFVQVKAYEKLLQASKILKYWQFAQTDLPCWPLLHRPLQRRPLLALFFKCSRSNRFKAISRKITPFRAGVIKANDVLQKKRYFTNPAVETIKDVITILLNKTRETMRKAMFLILLLTN